MSTIWAQTLPRRMQTIMSTSQDITKLLRAWGEGDSEALAKLTPALYRELHRMAHRYMRRERSDHTLQTTALINEAYVRLIDWKNVEWQIVRTFSAWRQV